MKLGSKIFLAFFLVLLTLLGTTLTLVGQAVEQRETKRILAELQLAKSSFQNRLHERQQATLKLLQIITQDQKYRSFLAQIKDNFFPFTEEISQDVGGDIVFMSDEEGEIRAHSPANRQIDQWLQKNRAHFAIDEVLEEGSPVIAIIGIDNRLLSFMSVPLKESLSDNYAVGAITITNEVDDVWVTEMAETRSDIQLLFYSQTQPLAAKGVDKEVRALFLQSALSNKTMFQLNQQRYIFHLVPLQGDTGYLLMANLDQALEPFNQLQRQILIYGLIALTIGLLLSKFISLRIVTPLKELVSGTQAIAQGNFDHRVVYQSKDEIGQLTRAFNKMTQELKEKEFIRTTFNRYLNPKIVRHILSDPQQLKLGGERQIQSILFSDLADFTQISEMMPPDALIALLNQYLSNMTHILTEHDGILDKYIGDAIMSYWGPLSTQGNHAQQACLTALAMQKRLRELRPDWIAHGLPALNCRIGITTGAMIVGNIGSEENCSYTCIGDTVNLSSRLEGLNKYYGTEIIIDAETYAATNGLFCRELDTIVVKGREEGTSIYQLIGVIQKTLPAENEANRLYAEALQHYYLGQFKQAEAGFKQTLQSHPLDSPSVTMRNRCRQMQQQPPAIWNGIYKMTEK